MWLDFLKKNKIIMLSNWSPFTEGLAKFISTNSSKFIENLMKYRVNLVTFPSRVDTLI
jgi:hypothetical protein